MAIEFSIVQSVGECGILQLSEREDENQYTSIYQTVMDHILDFQFDPVHPDEIAVISQNTLSIFSNQTRKTLLNVDTEQEDLLLFKRAQNAIAYSPKKYVVAYYQQGTNGFSLVDLDQQECIYSSKEIFKRQGVPASCAKPGKISMSFSRSGNSLVMSNSEASIVIYDT